MCIRDRGNLSLNVSSKPTSNNALPTTALTSSTLKLGKRAVSYTHLDVYKRQTLYILSIAQKQLKITKLPNLCSILKDSIKDTLSTILRSSRVRVKFFEKIDKSAERGDINELFRAAIATDSIDSDIHGYARALRRGAEISMELFNYSNRSKVILDLRKKALKYATRFSYLVCGFVIITMIIQIS